MSALTKADLAEKLFEELGLNKREAKEMVEVFYGMLEFLCVSKKLQNFLNL